MQTDQMPQVNIHQFATISVFITIPAPAPRAEDRDRMTVLTGTTAQTRIMSQEFRPQP